MCTFSTFRAYYTVYFINFQGEFFYFRNFIYNAQKEGSFIVFYDNFLSLCNEKGISPSAAVVEMGFQKSVVTRWKKSVPTDANKRKIAQYFNITVKELMGDTEEKQKEKPAEQSELEGVYLSFAREAQENKISPEDIKLAIETIKKLRGD